MTDLLRELIHADRLPSLPVREFTFGGIRINADAAVVDYLERPIPGLFATGEMTGGFFYLNYPAGAGLMRGAVFGRLAGTHAAQCARENRL